MTKKLLQIVTSILALIPILTGLLGLLGAADPLYEGYIRPNSVFLDSNLRFFSGVWLGLGIALASIISHIEKHTFLFRILWSSIFLGGIGRLLSSLFYMVSPLPFIGLTILELVGAPLFIYWQTKVANTAAESSD